MKVILTGGSSFTGYWFARTLAESGHEVTATLLRDKSEYNTGARAERTKLLEQVARVVYNCRFGDDKFQAVLGQGFDLLAHHAAVVGDYRNPAYDILAAVSANANRLPEILSSGAVKTLLLTSSVFAANEGIGTSPLRPISAYGLSKGLTDQIFSFLCEQHGIRFGRFVIPNPFGPLEEPKFTSYLLRTWRAGEVANVKTPAYIRDNIHVSLLARAYLRFCEELAAGIAPSALYPSGYVGTQSDFTSRLSREMAIRLGWKCSFVESQQEVFEEPRIRVNSDPASDYVGAWNESHAWDMYAEANR